MASQDSAVKAALCLEYAKAGTYGQLWWLRKLGEPSMVPIIKAKDVTEEMKKQELFKMAPLDGTGVNRTVRKSDIERWQSAHEELAKKIKEDLRLRNFWLRKHPWDSD